MPFQLSTLPGAHEFVRYTTSTIRCNLKGLRGVSTCRFCGARPMAAGRPHPYLLA
jgi:hypothetical protein